jgi:hypothetical protein
VFDRGIGLAGIALSVIFGALQFFQPQVPIWVSILGIVVGVFMLGISLGVIWSGRKIQKTVKPVDNALLRLHIYRDNRTPERLDAKNIFRWYFLSHIITSVAAERKKVEIVLPTAQP